ncbi:general odorant-binding protein 57c-like [Bradysia coprophila]|uniref:general odorant-binding protein 57c-like n=1 Tax=Bradysia coprophila TaxID=38358 RepID=UPI00187DD945|nr:general odorant-binding protein 57c-like [Bradysia coprophila]XP_037041663.1 general odorant-binding protein 57c-like [Bradysia coprophila]
MEKYIFVLSCVILVAFLNFSAVVAHPRAHPNFAQFDECKTAEKATDDDLKSLRERDPTLPKTRGAKCVLTCLGEKAGKIAGKRLNPDGVKNWFKDTPENTEQMQQTINEIVEECRNITDEDRCEAGFKIMECLKEGGMKRGLKAHGPPGKGQGPRN